MVVSHSRNICRSSFFWRKNIKCVQGIHAIEAITSVGPDKFKDKILIDLTNPYIYKDGHISLDPKNSGNTCLGQEIQKLLPKNKNRKNS